MFQLRRAVLRAAASAPSSILNTRTVNKTSPLLSLIISPALPSLKFGRFASDYAADGSGSGLSHLGDNSIPRNSGDSSFTRDRPFSGPTDLTPNPNIYVGNLVFHVTEDDLKKEFSSFGPIKNAIIAVDARGLSKGFGYVEFESTEQAQAAIEAKNQMVFEGRRLIVNYQAKTRRPTKENPPSKTLFVGNIAFEMTDAELNKLFREVRNCSDIRVAVDRRTGQPRGFAHAEFLTVEDATAAKEHLTDREIHGRASDKISNSTQVYEIHSQAKLGSRMSFLGGAECSTASNPLAQFSKHTQDDRSLQRDRLLDLPVKGTQSIRSDGGIDSIGTQDNIINDFRMQNSQLVQEDFSVSYNTQYEPFMKIGPQSPEVGEWTKEFTSKGDISNQLSVDYHAFQSMPINLSEYSQFEQRNGESSHSLGVGALQIRAERLKQRNHQMNMGLAMDIGIGDIAMGYMPTQFHQPYRSPRYEGKGKAKMIELDDQNWEEQFKQIDLLSEKQDLEESNAVETELDQVDKSILGSERNDFGDFESIWKGIKAQTSIDIDSSIEDQMADPSSRLDHWDDVPFQSHQIGEYLFEEENLFKDVLNPFEEGVRIMSDGGNLSLAALAFEAAVLKEPDHVNAWVMLGSAQAQNEKETPAIRALEKALKLDPANLTALMSLAVSYTNEGYDSMTYHSLERWLSFKYPSIINPNSPSLSISQTGFTDRAALHERVIELFIQAAQLSPDGEHMDPDVQVGLGVLFYGAEEYDKAVDCFSAALASTESGLSNKRDQLHLLWNRLGATLANSGRSEEAIAAYEKALTIRPNFVRARYNLGVSCINIGCYEEAASHLLSALAMHKIVENEGRQKARDILNGSTSDGTSGTLNDSQLDSMISQNQSNNLYDTLRRVFSQMGRRDLADRVVIDMDVESFRPDFDF